jgi:hypothetical protein
LKGADPMLSTGLDMKSYAILADDGAIGHVADLLFDDQSWLIRWMVVRTGGWLSGRKVLIHPGSIARVDHAAHTIRVSLSMEKVAGSPEISTDEPVSRQMQYSLYGYYGYDPYWGGGIYPGGIGFIPPHTAHDGTVSDVLEEGQGEGDPHLRSIVSVTGYHIQASDGPIGHLENFLLDEQDWKIAYLAIATRNWWAGQHVLVCPVAVRQIIWLEGSIDLSLTRAMIKASPVWSPDEIDFPAYQALLHDHYGWPPARMVAA